MMSKEGMRPENSNQVIRWVTRMEAVSQELPRPVSGNNRSHRDPTAEAAIGNVMREEKRRKANQSKEQQSRAQQTHKQRRDCIQRSKGGQRDVKE